MSEPLKPWEQGYVAPTVIRKTKSEIGKLGGLTFAARKAAGLPDLPKSDKTGKMGVKRTNAANQARADATTEATIPLKKKLQLDRFVYEYLHDFNASMAYIRAGGSPERATVESYTWLRTNYVQTQLRLVTDQIEEDNIVTRKEVLMGIKREAHHHGEDGSSSARVSAWKLLAKIKGMEAPTKIEAEVLHRGGVMEVPMVATDVEWEDVASQSQLALKNDVRT